MMKINKRVTFILLFFYIIGGIFYYYKSADIPIDFTSTLLRKFYILSILIVSILIFMPTMRFIDQLSKPLQIIIIATEFTLILHNLLWTYILLNFSIYYIDEKTIYQYPDNAKHKVIIQYLDEGALGSHHREVEIIELIPGLRYIKKYH